MPRRSRRRAVILATMLLAAAAAAAFVIPAACLHWPDAPYMDAMSSLPEGVADQLQAAFPGATLTTRVYRTHMEGRGGEYRIVSRRFVFEDAAGGSQRGLVDADGTLSTTRATMVDELPEELHALFFEGRFATAKGGRLSGRAWRFTEASTKETGYEFEFVAGEQRGFGSISASGRNQSAYHFVGTAE